MHCDEAGEASLLRVVAFDLQPKVPQDNRQLPSLPRPFEAPVPPPSHAAQGESEGAQLPRSAHRVHSGPVGGDAAVCSADGFIFTGTLVALPAAEAAVAAAAAASAEEDGAGEDHGDEVDGVAADVRSLLLRLQALLAAQGAELSDCLRVRLYLRDMRHFAAARVRASKACELAKVDPRLLMPHILPHDAVKTRDGTAPLFFNSSKQRPD